MAKDPFKSHPRCPTCDGPTWVYAPEVVAAVVGLGAFLLPSWGRWLAFTICVSAAIVMVLRNTRPRISRQLCACKSCIVQQARSYRGWYGPGSASEISETANTRLLAQGEQNLQVLALTLRPQAEDLLALDDVHAARAAIAAAAGATDQVLLIVPKGVSLQDHMEREVIFDYPGDTVMDLARNLTKSVGAEAAMIAALASCGTPGTSQ